MKIGLEMGTKRTEFQGTEKSKRNLCGNTREQGFRDKDNISKVWCPKSQGKESLV